MNVVFRAVTKLFSLWVGATYPFVSVGRKLSIHYSAVLSRRSAPRIKIGNSVIIDREAWINVPYLPGYDSKETAIVLEDGCGIGKRCVISAKNHIHIGKNAICAPSALLMDHNHEFTDVTTPIKNQGVTPGGTIRIEEGCWIGYGAAILCNEGEIVVGRNSVVAANAVVNRSVPPYSVVAGNPARVVKQFDPSRNEWVLGSVRSS